MNKQHDQIKELFDDILHESMVGKQLQPFSPRIYVSILPPDTLSLMMELEVAGRRYACPVNFTRGYVTHAPLRDVDMITIYLAENLVGFKQAQHVEAYFKELGYIQDKKDFVHLCSRVFNDWTYELPKILAEVSKDSFGDYYAVKAAQVILGAKNE